MKGQIQTPACAHCKVILKRVDHPGGTSSDYWECADGCGTKFWPASHTERIERELIKLKQSSSHSQEANQAWLKEFDDKRIRIMELDRALDAMHHRAEKAEADSQAWNKSFHEANKERVELDMKLAKAEEESETRLAIIKDHCEDGSKIKELARPLLGDFAVEGDSYGVPASVDICEELTKQLYKLRSDVKPLLEALRHCYDVVEWPGPGESSQQSDALQAFLSAHPELIP